MEKIYEDSFKKLGIGLSNPCFWNLLYHWNCFSDRILCGAPTPSVRSKRGELLWWKRKMSHAFSLLCVPCDYAWDTHTQENSHSTNAVWYLSAKRKLLYIYFFEMSNLETSLCVIFVWLKFSNPDNAYHTSTHTHTHAHTPLWILRSCC